MFTRNNAEHKGLYIHNTHLVKSLHFFPLSLSLALSNFSFCLEREKFSGGMCTRHRATNELT